MYEPIIICGFPGIGKSTYANNRKDVEDLESSNFSWIWNAGREPERDPEFPGNYAAEIKLHRDIYKGARRFIFVSCHKEVREELKRQGVPYIIVAPVKEAKDEYLRRYLTRGSDIKFIELLNKHWDEWLDALEEDGEPVIHLKPYQTLSDLLWEG